ncbi:hypothetical protein [Anoxynatronum sibiricum]|uniref:Uncharacterized protein n=1 Tax=Anoxynatronum sibiricum TaxID=210623 RepID=A0ABU9VTA1_9CLOT
MNANWSPYNGKRSLGLVLIALSTGLFIYAYTQMDPFESGVVAMFISAFGWLAGLFAALYYHSREKDFLQALKNPMLECQLSPHEVQIMAAENRMTPRGKAPHNLLISLEGVYLLGRFFRLKDYELESITWKSGNHREKEPGRLSITYQVLNNNPFLLADGTPVTHSEEERRKKLTLLIPHQHKHVATEASSFLRNHHFSRV